jgi:hypothetical protein
MLAQRSAHYWLWFLLFGLVSTVVAWSHTHALDAESTWLLVTGLLGLVFGSRVFGHGFARPYDLLVALLFTGVGMVGILHNLGIDLAVHNSRVPAGAIDSAAVLGLSLSLPYALIHTVLGMTSLNHALKAKMPTPSVTVRPSATGA